MRVLPGGVGHVLSRIARVVLNYSHSTGCLQDDRYYQGQIIRLRYDRGWTCKDTILFNEGFKLLKRSLERRAIKSDE